MKLINVEPKENYILRVYLDDDSIIDFDVKSEIERIPCYKPLYNKELFNTVKFKNKRIYWNEQFDFHLDQIIESGKPVNIKIKKPLSIVELKKIIQTTQAIEGYKPASLEIVERVKQLRAQHAVQVSPRK